jgi:hypothetical protein
MPSLPYSGVTKWGYSLLTLVAVVFGVAAVKTSAQTQSLPPIKVESREVTVPVYVIQVTKDPKGKVVYPNGEMALVWLQHSREITGLSSKSLHIFEDGVEQKIQHLSVEKEMGWGVHDNIGRHLEYSCTPRGIWVGPDITQASSEVNDKRVHAYFLTYIPPPSPRDSCHRITVKVDRKHATIFAPGQYCNTKDPLSDPLKDTELGNRMLDFAKSKQDISLPFSLQVSSFRNSFDNHRINVSADIPADLLKRRWEGIQLRTSC